MFYGRWHKLKANQRANQQNITEGELYRPEIYLLQFRHLVDTRTQTAFEFIQVCCI